MYPESASQCPICGFAKRADSKASADISTGAYQHVKGGRFSQGNVRKRNEEKGVPIELDSRNADAPKKKGSNFVLLIFAIIFMMILIVVLAMFIIKLAGGMKEVPQYGIVPTPTMTQGEQSVTIGSSDATTESVVNEKWQFSNDSFELIETGATVFVLDNDSIVSASEISWTSDDEKVATVEDGVVTAVGSGSTTIRAEFNGTSKSCVITCNLAVVETTEETVAEIDVSKLRMSDADGDVTLYYNGSAQQKSFELYILDENNNRIDVEWIASKDGIVSIEGNKITAIVSRKVNVTVTAVCYGKEFTCTVRISAKP